MGVGYDVNGLMAAFVKSPAHYENIVDPEFNYVGVGVSYGADGRLYTTHDFMGLDTSNPNPPPATAPAPRRRQPHITTPAPAPEPAPPAPPPAAASAPSPSGRPCPGARGPDRPPRGVGLSTVAARHVTLSTVTAVIEAHDLTRSFGGNVALDGLSFELEAGEVLALLGPNGAGKTTTVRLLNGVLHPDRGGARVLGSDPVDRG